MKPNSLTIEFHRVCTQARGIHALIVLRVGNFYGK